MGCWMRAKGRLEVVPPPDDKVLAEFWEFSNHTRPEYYEHIGESFANTWFFDKNNKLACIAGKFAEPTIWLEWMNEHFFEPRGYELIGTTELIGEGDPEEDVFEEQILGEYEVWKRRASELIKYYRHINELYK